MTLVPDWDSIESTTRASNVLFWVSMAALLLLLLAELGSHVYGSRASNLLATRSMARERGRLLATDQLARLIELLSASPKPARPVELMALDGDGEANLLAKQIKTAMESAGVPQVGVLETFLIGGAGDGVLVRQRKAAAPEGVAIADALRNVGLYVRLIEKPDISEGVVEVFVSHRTYSSP